MAVGTTRPTLTTAWQAITDQITAYLTHDGGPPVEIAIGSSAPAASVKGSVFRQGEHPRTYIMATGEELYARQTGNPEGDPAQITVLQSAYAG